jgi:hypothetical protein
MALSNAERQQRFRQRRHALVASADLKGYGYAQPGTSAHAKLTLAFLLTLAQHGRISESADDDATEWLSALWVLKPLPVISNTVPKPPTSLIPFAPPAAVVANRSPWGVGDQAAEQIRAVSEVKGDQGSGGTGIAVGGLGNLDYRAVAAPAEYCRAEQVAVGVGDQAAVRKGTVGAVEAD